MKLQIRKSCFETNSSSTHSFSIGKSENNLMVSDDGYVHTCLGEFGWEIEIYPEATAKLSYIILVAAYFNNCDFWSHWEEDNWFESNYNALKETKEYQEIEQCIRTKMNCDGIIIDENSEGYIDHQSIEYASFDKWLSYTGADSIADFIFGNIILYTDNDNH